MPSIRIVLSVVGAMLTAEACGSDSSDGQAIARDSSGVSIIENSRSAWTPGHTWTLVDSALVDIGGGSGKPEYELDQTRGPLRLGDGRIVLFHGGVNELRFYDATGSHLRSVGRTGSGPGEYQNVTGLWLVPGDSLVLVESFARRLSIVDSGGQYIRSFSVGGGGGQFVPVGGKADAEGPMGRFGDGSVLVLSKTFVMNQARSGVYRDSTLAIRYAGDGTVLDTLGTLPALEMEQVPVNMGPQTISAPSIVPLGRQTVVTVSGDRWVVARNNAWELEVRQRAGPVTTLVRAAVQPASLTPSDIASHRKQQLKAIEGLRNLPEPLKQQLRARIEHAKYPEKFPFFTALLIDTDGNLWAQEAASPSEQVQRWAVVDTVGVWLGTVTMPREFRPTFISSNLVYGVWLDADDVEHVRAYGLRKE